MVSFSGIFTRTYPLCWLLVSPEDSNTPIVTHSTVFHYWALQKVLNSGAGCPHPFPCPTWHPSAQAAPCVHCTLSVVESVDVDISLHQCTAKRMRWVPLAALLCNCLWGHLRLQPVPAGLAIWLTGCPDCYWQGYLEHRLCTGVFECLQIAPLLSGPFPPPPLPPQ